MGTVPPGALERARQRKEAAERRRVSGGDHAILSGADARRAEESRPRLDAMAAALPKQETAYLVRCGECGFLGETDPHSHGCASCGYDGGFTPGEAQNDGALWMRTDFSTQHKGTNAPAVSAEEDGAGEEGA